MQAQPDDWRSPDVEALLDAFLGVETREDAAAFMRDLCTLGELRDLAQRWAVVRLLDAGLHYSEISRRTGASTATITRIASWLHHGVGGYRLALERTRAASGAGTSVYPDAEVPPDTGARSRPYPDAGSPFEAAAGSTSYPDATTAPEPAPVRRAAPPAGRSGRAR